MYYSFTHTEENLTDLPHWEEGSKLFIFTMYGDRHLTEGCVFMAKKSPMGEYTPVSVRVWTGGNLRGSISMRIGDDGDLVFSGPSASARGICATAWEMIQRAFRESDHW